MAVLADMIEKGTSPEPALQFESVVREMERSIIIGYQHGRFSLDEWVHLHEIHRRLVGVSRDPKSSQPSILAGIRDVLNNWPVFV